MSEARSARNSRFVFAVLGGLSAIGPASSDFYSPAFPAVARSLHTSNASVQVTLSVCLLGLGIGQIFAGPLSDRWGRKRLLLFATAGYGIFSLACASASNIGLLDLYRLMQGLVGGGCIVVALATVQDLNPGTSSARYLSRLMLIAGTTPVLAPSVGSAVLRFTDWRGIFVLQAVISGLLFMSTKMALPETLPPGERSVQRIGEIGLTMGRLARDRVFFGYVLCNCLASATLFAYIGGFSFLVEDSYHRSPQLFGLLYGLNALGLVAVSQLNAHLVAKKSPRSPLVRGLCVSAGASIVFPLLLISGSIPLVIAESTIFVVTASRGMVISNATSLAMARTPEHRGSAAAMIGLLRYGFGAIASPLSGIGHKTSAMPMAIVLATFTTAALFAGVVLGRERRTVEAAVP